jgi:hypothetical protein
VITFGDDDQLLRPWLVREVGKKLGLGGDLADLHAVVCAQLRACGSFDEVCLAVHEVLSAATIQPGALLRDLAKLAQCRLFFTLTFDPLMERALCNARGGPALVKPWSFSPKATRDDFPASSGTVLGYLFGKASASPGFHLWDADAVEFVYQLQRQLASLPNLGTTLAENNLLIIGTQFSDWMVRFLLRAISPHPLTVARKTLLLADHAPPNNRDAVIFYDCLKGGIEVLEASPIEFAREFARRAAALERPLPDIKRIANIRDKMPPGSIFVSYVRRDAEPVFRLVEKLIEADCLVWLDVRNLFCGDDFENDLEDEVKKRCGFFVSVISANTEALRESYCLKERNWAASRYTAMGELSRESSPFYFPVVIDDSPIPPRNEPRAFASISAERAVGGDISKRFIARIAALQQRLGDDPGSEGSSLP